eukprot:CAMPEP_0183746690 /NCGR_PEP_ID=MMETSP0737-20130205/66886_1 /TAXON_ID=385413 /ORGANISM="Thalassiosira miniscula, Strain CCMP1093" /LENGTH=1250 /DNA_ID=CAMNT_0025982393 /DNA_START=67 /DNA_END=3820 /DNA_ORIENTATION=-
MADADRSSIEIKVLLKNLDPTKPSIKHKDRLRRLNKFRNYVTANPAPEFYDDDYSLMLLGSESPAAMEDEDLSHMTLYGLLRAAGCPSTDHKGTLKRSARPAISLLRLLCFEYEATTNNPNAIIMSELNGFAAALCALNVPQLRTLHLDIHIGTGDSASGSRGGSKDDACHLLALILARHTDTDYEKPKPLKVRDFLPEGRGQAEFEAWLGEHASPDVRNKVKRNVESAEAGDRGELGVGFGEARNLAAGGIAFDDDDDDDDDDEDEDVLAWGEDTADGASSPTGGAAVPSDGKPRTWAETHMASDKQKDLGAIFLEEEREKDMAERKKAEEEKQRIFGRDPLGIHNEEQFDLQDIDNNRDHFIKQTLAEIELEIDSELALANESGVEKVNWLEAQRQALLAIMDEKRRSSDDGEGAEDAKDSQNYPSVLPTKPDFDPILFLTLVHRNASYQELLDSTSRLSRKTDNQVERLQNLVRDNFSLFIRCSEGIDVFADNRGNSGSKYYSSNTDQLQNQFGTLDSIAQSCSEQARKSFKPLLDNTNEVRKVQSALAVLQRVAPLLQVPGLMRQHIENANFASVVKAYRKILVIDENHCDVDLLQYVRTKAGEAAQDARQDLELILADETSSGKSLLDAIRDLGQLLELLEEDEDGSGGNASEGRGASTPRSSGQSSNAMKAGTFTIDRHVICVRDYPPALACLFLQTTHFRSLVDKAVGGTEATAERIFRGEFQDNASNQSGSASSSSEVATQASSQRSRDKRWKFEVLEARVDATKSAVALAKNWLPRLLQIGLATQEAEKRRMARHKRRKMASLSANNKSANKTDTSEGNTFMMSAHDVFKSIVNPALKRLVEHISYCSLGCANQGSKYKISATFGRGSADRLRSILKSPLPPTQTAKCALDLAELAEAIQSSNESMLTIRSLGDDGEATKLNYQSPLEKCSTLANDAVVMIEQRVCIYSFDACARKCSVSASGSGVFDGDSLLQCVQKLSDDLTRSEECSKEIEKGVLMVSQKCCEGLAGYVKDRSDAARLRVVAECADALNTTIVDVVREVSYLTDGQSESLESNLSSVISALEREMFDVFLESVKRSVSSCARLGLIDTSSENDQKNKKADESGPFPPYLAASFLTIVRCRAQVERALRDLSRSEGTTYQFLALQTASDGVVENICLELKSKLTRVRARADVYSIHLQFLISTLKKYLSDEILSLASDTRRMLLSASSGGKGMGNGPEGLTALENLERLGRVYVMCLGE